MGSRATLVACLLLAACGRPAAALVPAERTAAPPARVAHAGAGPHAISEFLIRSAGPNAQPFAIAAARDGSMWFTESGTSAVARIAPNGAIRQFALPAQGSQPEGIVGAPDGSLYFAEHGGQNYDTHVARVTAEGRITEWNDSNFLPEGAAPGPDGSVWFTQSCAGLAVLARGKVTQYLVSGITGESPAIVRGPDGAMWFAEDGTARIGRIGPEGKLRIYTGLMYQTKFNDIPEAVTVGRDGNLWWTSLQSNAIWAMDVHGHVVHDFTVPTPGSNPWGIAAGRDGALWFTEWTGNKIGRVTTDGVFSEYPLPTANARPQGIARGRDGSLWFVETGANRIGRISP